MGMLDSLVQVFFGTSVLIENHKFTKCLTHALSIARLDKNVKALNKLEFIRNNTTKDMEIPIATLEHIYERSRKHGLSKTFEFHEKEITLNQINLALFDALNDITYIVSEIADANEVDFEFDLSKYKVAKG